MVVLTKNAQPVEVAEDEPLRVADYLHFQYEGKPVITGTLDRS